MNERKIEFSVENSYIEQNKDILPIPIKHNLPNWYKDLKHDLKLRTVKGCKPFLDSLTSGYLLKLPQDISVKHNVFNEKINKIDSFFGCPVHKETALKVNLNYNQEEGAFHNKFQVEGWPYAEKNGEHIGIFKVKNPWTIKTPPGYSCLFIPPLNNHDDRFEIIPAIVDTDCYSNEVNFPIILNSYKYPKLDDILKRGTPYVQIIPFKRDSWKMNIKSKKYTDFFKTKFINVYQNLFWRKKRWK
jgi:hypothetical protein